MGALVAMLGKQDKDVTKYVRSPKLNRGCPGSEGRLVVGYKYMEGRVWNWNGEMRKGRKGDRSERGW